MNEQTTLGFLFGGGEMGERMRTLDWSSTPLGPVEGWPQSLRSPLSVLLSSKAQIILFWGPEYVVLYNDSYRPVFGAKHPHMLGKPGRVAWSEIWDTGANLHALLDGVVRTGEAFSARDLLFVLERYGFVEETYFDVSYDPVRIESGEVGGVFCIVSETTGRVVGERRLALLRDLAARNSSARSTREACIVAMETLEGTGQDIRFALAYVDGELQACTPEAEDLLAAAPPHLVHELAMGSGRLVVGIHPLRPFDDQHQSFLNLVAGQIATTIANAQAHEAERKRAESLAELDRAKTVFFSNVSHEFRTPLTLILGPVEDSLADVDHPLEPEQRDRQEVVRRNALRLLKMVNSLLDFSRIEAGRIGATFEPTDLSALTADLASTFRSAVERAGLRLVVDAPPLGEPIYVDRGMWEKIVLNLLSNAFKFTLDGEIAIVVSGSDGFVELEVRDTGSGIPAAELSHIFERFHRVEGTRGRTQEGTGIGLALVQELVKLHGGEITVESTPSQGSSFHVRIPTGVSHLPKEQIAPVSERESAAASAIPFVEEALRWLPASGAVPATPEPVPAHAARQRRRILLADDNADMREYVTRLLAEHYDVVTVGDGEAALHAVREAKPDLVLADVMMPLLDGFAFLQALRSDPETRALPILLLSARAGEEARIEGMRAGADDYLVKPFSARDLLARVEAHLEMSRMRREALERERELRADAEAARGEAELARANAEEANKAKATFLATMSHELRTPLNAILGYTDLLDAEITGPLTSAQRKQIERIQLGARHLLHIIEEILTFSRIEAGREEVRVEPVDLVDLTVETCRLVEPLAAQKSLAFRFDAPEQLRAMTDPGKVRQILLNLVSNAIKFTQRGEVRLDLHSGADAISFTVRDTGQGIASDQVERVFEAFYQVDASGAQMRSGTGLGLSVSRGLARLLGGEIQVTSTIGQGSTFTLTLPAAAPVTGQSATSLSTHEFAL